MKRIALLGAQVDALTMEDLHALIAHAVAEGKRWIIANHNLHSIYLYHHDPKMGAFYARAHHVHVDGMSLVFLGKLLHLPLRREHRVTYVDWVRPLVAEAAHQGFRVFYLGSRPGVAEEGAKILRTEHPCLQMATHHGHFNTAPDSLENQHVLAAIRDYRPHILMVGMGMPRQEHWIVDHFEQIEANAILTAGACMDYVAGAVPVPPRWMGRLGLEWLYRLASEPRRLWRRYLIEPWFILRLFLRDVWGRKG
ncbi:MAG: glycosyl transferase [Candidatus Fraserbacteria bacterium RBG_16_55_9]|uniref:Glycosyl transferase n=1 Tax=Fraserbacteria sp. (strain RBG_16_55_9) TaxID=1817864 RepID=A0A1F5UPU3_FRAXR|nr:MAG: glycosyl transferase [Candidatus Fraserbacteria bacterium RBG_16_55_9]